MFILLVLLYFVFSVLWLLVRIFVVYFFPIFSNISSLPHLSSDAAYWLDRAYPHRPTGTNREYWVNMRTQISQWTRPYLRKNFRAQDLDMETFVLILLRYDVMAKRYVCAVVV
jgi:hypothetical protein